MKSSLENTLWSKSSILVSAINFPSKEKNSTLSKPWNKKTVDSKNLFILHAGTKQDKGKILSAGGRVLNIVGKGQKFNNIRKKIINLIKKINWKNGFYRKDIGWRVIKKQWEL